MLETDRLMLRPLDARHAEAVLSYYERNREFLAPWEPFRDEWFYTVDHQRRLLEEEVDRMADGRMFKCWIFAKDNPEKIIGMVALSEIVRGSFLSCYMGYKIDGGVKDMGYMSEAVGRMVDYAFGELGLHRIEANILPRNGASQRVVEKNGFINEGLSRKYIRINGVWEDHIHMVRLNEGMEADDHV